LIAWLSLESGIAPSVLLNESEAMIEAMIEVQKARTKQQHQRR
jgi:hypothetical protein